MAFSNENHITIDIPTPKAREPSIHGSFPPIENLEYFPERVLVQIFSEVDDKDLLHLSDCCDRFEAIAKFAFKTRYASRYFVFDGSAKAKQKFYTDLFERFGGYANIKAVKVKSIQDIDENHWIPKLLLKHTKELKRLIFHRCWFKRINIILSQHIDITHLIIRLGVWNDHLAIPNYRNLKQLEVSDNNTTALYDKSTIVRAMRNNPTLETLNLSRCDPIVPMHCIAKHSKRLKKLNLISTANDVWEMSNETMDSVADSLKHLESLRLTISNFHHIELVKRLSLKCKNLKHIELDNKNFDGTISNEDIIEAATQFPTIESLELTHFHSVKNLAKYLPTWPRLRHLTVFMDEPDYSETFIPSMLNASPSLKTITINTWNDATFSWPKFFLSTAIFKEVIKTIREPARFREELKEFQPEFGFVTAKEIIRCGSRSHRIKNESIFFSFHLIFLFFAIIFTFCFISVAFTALFVYTSW